MKAQIVPYLYDLLSAARLTDKLFNTIQAMREWLLNKKVGSCPQRFERLAQMLDGR